MRIDVYKRYAVGQLLYSVQVMAIITAVIGALKNQSTNNDKVRRLTSVEYDAKTQMKLSSYETICPQEMGKGQRRMSYTLYCDVLEILVRDQEWYYYYQE